MNHSWIYELDIPIVTQKEIEQIEPQYTTGRWSMRQRDTKTSWTRAEDYMISKQIPQNWTSIQSTENSPILVDFPATNLHL